MATDRTGQETVNLKLNSIVLLNNQKRFGGGILDNSFSFDAFIPVLDCIYPKIEIKVYTLRSSEGCSDAGH